MADGMMADTLAMLAEPFPPEAISWRLGSTTKDKSKGMPLAYIDARDVMERLDQVCGPAGWQCEYVAMANGTTCCRIGLRLNGEWVWKSNGGSATGDVDNEKEREMAEKGGYSDAFKRAAVLWGVGRYLYGMSAPWVKIEPRGASHVMAEGEQDKLDDWYRKYIKQNIKNAAPSDAGQRETPKSQQKAGAAVSPPDAAPANFHDQPSNVPGGFKSLKTIEVDEEQRTDHTADPEWAVLSAQLTGNCECRADVLAWWEARKKDLKARKPHFAKAFYQGEVIPFAASFAQTVVYEDEPGARG